MAYPQVQGMAHNQQQNHTLMMGLPGQQVGQMPEAYIDPRGRARIDEWRQGVQPD